MRSLVKHILFGKELPQEYICVPRSLSDQARLYLVGDEETDITDEHILLGYKPLIFGSSIDLGNDNVELKIRQNETVQAEITVRRVEGLPGLFLYMGVRAELNMSSILQRSFIQWREKLKEKGPSNIDLDRSLYKQVIAAYIIPRAISLIAVRKQELYNDFPTDLHGSFGENRYASSLRIGGMACGQVMESKSIKLYSMSLDQLNMVYKKGENHMRDWRAEDPTDIEGAISYKELVVDDYKDIGLHRIFTYRIVEERNFNAENAELAHCHREYIQWRSKKKIPTEYVLRSPVSG